MIITKKYVANVKSVFGFFAEHIHRMHGVKIKLLRNPFIKHLRGT